MERTTLARQLHLGQEWLTCELNIASVGNFTYIDGFSCALVTDNKTCLKTIAINCYSISFIVYTSVFRVNLHMQTIILARKVLDWTGYGSQLYHVQVLCTAVFQDLTTLLKKWMLRLTNQSSV